MASVQEKVNAIKQKCAEVNAGSKKIVTGIKEQERVNKAAVIMIHAGTIKLANKISSYIKKFYFGKD